MGGAMWWGRLVGRNNLRREGYGVYLPHEDRADPTAHLRSLIAGELDRMQQDYLAHASGLAAACDISREQAERALRAFFSMPEPGCVKCQEPGGFPDHRCYYHEFIWRAPDYDWWAERMARAATTPEPA